MTKITTDKKRRRPLLPILFFGSIAAHVIVIAILTWTGVLRFEQIFDRKDEKRKAEVAKKKSKSIREKQKQARSKRELSKNQSARLRKEAEKKRKDEIRKRVETMRENQRQLEQVKRDNLKELEERTAEEIRDQLLAEIDHVADYVQKDLEKRMRAPDRQTDAHKQSKDDILKTQELLDQLTDLNNQQQSPDEADPQSADSADSQADLDAQHKKAIEDATKDLADAIADAQKGEPNAQKSLDDAADKLADAVTQAQDASPNGEKTLNDVAQELADALANNDQSQSGDPQANQPTSSNEETVQDLADALAAAQQSQNGDPNQQESQSDAAEQLAEALAAAQKQSANDQPSNDASQQASASKNQAMSDAAQKLTDALAKASQQQSASAKAEQALADALAKSTDSLSKNMEQAIRNEKNLHDPNKAVKHPLTFSSSKIADLAKQLANTSPDMNKMRDTSSAKSDPAPSHNRPTDSMSMADLYKEAQRLEKQTAQTYEDARAAELALKQNSSLDEARSKLTTPNISKLPDLSAALAGQGAPKTVGDLNQQRATMDSALQQTRQRELRSNNMLKQLAGKTSGRGAGNPAASYAGNGLAMGRASARGGPGGMSKGDIGDGHLRQAGGAFMKTLDSFRRLGIDQRLVQAQALPGRRFSKDTPRHGWLYVNTWYMIGPWENHGRIDYNNVHPPEMEIDFDAVYTDGKKGKVYTNQKRWDEIDGTLRWRFTQSDTIRVLPYVQAPDATNYAYTELYFEEDTTMLIAIASDDAACVWINGKLTWEEQGLSSWNMGERFEPAHFKKGTNKVLVRLENGPSETLFSFVICPPEALKSN